MKLLVISLLAISLAYADKLEPQDYPPPPPVPASAALKSVQPKASSTTVKPKLSSSAGTVQSKKKVPSPPAIVKTLPPKKPILKKPLNLAKLKKPAVEKKPPVPVQQVQQAERRDSSYGAPAPAKRKVIIKPAGPSKQYGWVGHGRYAPLNIPNPFPKDLPKWIPMGNNIFEAGLLYPGKPGSSAPKQKPAPAPPAAPSYSAPAAPSYSPPATSYVPEASVDSYSAPVPAAAPAYNSPSPQPVYNPKPSTPAAPVKLPAGIPAQPSYPSQPSYGSSTLIGQIQNNNAYSEPVTAVPAYTTPAPAAPAYNSYAPPSQPSYSQPKPFTVFGSQAQSSYSQPQVEAVYEPVGKPGNFPAFNALPDFDSSYEAQASYESSKAEPAPVNYNAYDVPIKVEETYGSPAEEDQDVYFIFYEDSEPKPAPAGGAYVSEAAAVQPPQNNQFRPPDNEDIRTIYVPYDSAVNVPEIFDVNVGSSFGYSEPQQQQQPSYSFNPGSSAYDNPISSFDAPIYDENSYTAAASSYDANTFSDTLYRENAGSLVRKVRKPAIIDDSVDDATSVEFKTSFLTSNLPYGSRLSSKNRYNSLGL